MTTRIGRVTMAELHGASLDSFDMRAAAIAMSPVNSTTVMQKNALSPAYDIEEKLNSSMDSAGVKSMPFDEDKMSMMETILAKPSVVQKVLAEFVATFFLVFAGCGSILVDQTHGGDIAHVVIATSFGVAVMIMIYAVGHVSGAHLNPAVTLAFASVGRFPLLEVPGYVFGQVGGSLLASLVLRLILHDANLVGKAVNQPTDGDLQSFVVEAVITFVLMFVISGVASDSRAVGEMAGIAIGATIALNGVYAGPLSGASMNPARSIGPAVVANNYKSLHIYVGGPILGAIIGAWIYNVIRLPESPSMEKAYSKKNFLKTWFKF